MDSAAIANAIWPWAKLVLVLVAVIALIVLIVVLVRAAKTMKDVNELASNANKQVTPMLENVGAIVEDVKPVVTKVDPLMERVGLTVDTVNLELLRVDGILEDVEQVTDMAGNAANAVSTITAAPTEAASALIDKARSAISGMGGTEGESRKKFVYPVGKGAKSE